MLPPADLAFAGRNTRQLRRAGLSGAPLRVALSGDALVFTGAEGGTLRIEAALIERTRFGHIEEKYGRFYVTRIWPRGVETPLIVEPEKSDEQAYGTVMQAFAGRVAAVRGVAGDARAAPVSGSGLHGDRGRADGARGLARLDRGRGRAVGAGCANGRRRGSDGGWDQRKAARGPLRLKGPASSARQSPKST